MRGGKTGVVGRAMGRIEDRWQGADVGGVRLIWQGEGRAEAGCRVIVAWWKGWVARTVGRAGGPGGWDRTVGREA
jgi:hypothetical protein